MLPEDMLLATLSALEATEGFVAELKSSTLPLSLMTLPSTEVSLTFSFLRHATNVLVQKMNT